MSRSGYVEADDYSDNPEWAQIRWAGALNSAINGARGQAFLREMVTALDAMPVKELHPEILVENGCVCAMGAVAVARNLDVSEIDAEDSRDVARVLGIAAALASEVAYQNDEAGSSRELPVARWVRMRAWAVSYIVEPL